MSTTDTSCSICATGLCLKGRNSTPMTASRTAKSADATSDGGLAIMAHGGYSKEIYADAALGTLSGVEFLQFGIYREIGLTDWYHMLNTGYRFPALVRATFRRAGSGRDRRPTCGATLSAAREGFRSRSGSLPTAVASRLSPRTDCARGGRGSLHFDRAAAAAGG